MQASYGPNIFRCEKEACLGNFSESTRANRSGNLSLSHFPSITPYFVTSSRAFGYEVIKAPLPRVRLAELVKRIALDVRERVQEGKSKRGGGQNSARSGNFLVFLRIMHLWPWYLRWPKPYPFITRLLCIYCRHTCA